MAIHHKHDETVEHLEYKQTDPETQRRCDIAGKKLICKLIEANPSFFGRPDSMVDQEFLGGDPASCDWDKLPDRGCLGDLKIISPSDVDHELCTDMEVREDCEDFEKLLRGCYLTAHIFARKRQEKGNVDLFISIHGGMKMFYIIWAGHAWQSGGETREADKPGQTGERARGNESYINVPRDCVGFYAIRDDFSVTMEGLGHYAYNSDGDIVGLHGKGPNFNPNLGELWVPRRASIREMEIAWEKAKKEPKESYGDRLKKAEAWAKALC